MVMIKLNINQAKTHLSAYVARVERGETIVLCRRNQPVAELRPLRQRRARKRPIGLAAGEFKIPKSFFESLPADLEATFAGEAP
jgi:prevent-host-death family protein